MSCRISGDVPDFSVSHESMKEEGVSLRSLTITNYADQSGNLIQHKFDNTPCRGLQLCTASEHIHVFRRIRMLVLRRQSDTSRTIVGIDMLHSLYPEEQ